MSTTGNSDAEVLLSSLTVFTLCLTVVESELHKCHHVFIPYTESYYLTTLRICTAACALHNLANLPNSTYMLFHGHDYSTDAFTLYVKLALCVLPFNLIDIWLSGGKTEDS